jgi:hypothetical protein
MTPLERRYQGAPELLQLYSRKLLKPGWAGATDHLEREFIRMARQVAGYRPRGRPFAPSVRAVFVAAPGAVAGILEGDQREVS